jgi:MoaA/NifB/PqqE/SkfB family radical SAM enzyme
MPVDDAPAWAPLPNQPGVMLIHLLNRCNLLCKHCYADAAPSQNTFLPPEWAVRSLKEADSLNVATIYLTGGEPFLYPKLPEVLDAVAQQRGFGLYVATNGTLIGAEEAALLKDSGAHAQVSIDGPEAYHDHFRGVAGAFRSAKSGIEQLVAAGVPVTVVPTVCQDNLGWLPWVAKWAASMGAEGISVQPLVQLGRGSDIRNRKLTERQLTDLYLQLSDLGYAYRPRGLRFSLSYRTHHFLLAHPCAAYVCDGSTCHRKVDKEIKKIVIREDGTVLPEIPTLDYRFALGNLREGTLTELVSDYFADGYAEFNRLCRTVYEDVMPTWASPIVPWDEIVSERSWEFHA